MKTKLLFIIVVGVLAAAPSTARAALSPTSTATFFIDTAGEIALMHVNPGDRVRVSVQVGTTDFTTPESSEHEGCINVSFNFPHLGFHALNIPCDVNLKWNTIYTVPTTSILGADITAQLPVFDGDEVANVTIAVNPVEVVRSTFSEVLDYEQLAHDAEQGADLARWLEKACEAVPSAAGKRTCEFVEGATEKAEEGLATHFQQLAATDPVDANFTKVALPQQPMPFLSSWNDTDDVALTAKALVADLQIQPYLLEAVIISINRASGAMQAGDKLWRRLQLTAAAQYLFALSAAIDAQIPLQKSLSDAWNRAGYPSLVPAADDIHNVQLALYASGFTSSETQQLETMGLTSLDITSLTTQLVTLDYTEVPAIGGFPGVLTYPPFTADLQSGSKSLVALGVTALTE